MCIVRKPIERRVGDDRIIKEIDPLGNVSVAGDYGRCPFVAFTDNFLEVVRLLLGEPLQPEVIDDQRSWCDQFYQLLLQRVVALTA